MYAYNDVFGSVRNIHMNKLLCNNSTWSTNLGCPYKSDEEDEILGLSEALKIG